MKGVWVAFPTAHPARGAEAVQLWSLRGYSVAVLTNTPYCRGTKADLNIHVPEYPGYWRSQNALAKAILAVDPDFRALCCAADDMRPDPNLMSYEIAEEYLGRFPDGFGVMQPIGDDLDGTDRICGSPFFGRGWIEEGYADGPYHAGYMQFFQDEELRIVAGRLGVLWDRPDLTHYHAHWTRSDRGKASKTDYQAANDKFWAADRRVFEARKAQGFPR